MKKKPEVLIVKIDKSTIKKNPDYGLPYILAPGRKEISFTMTGKLPEKMQDNKKVFVMWVSFDGFIETSEGYINNPDFAKELQADKIEGLTLSFKMEHVKIDNTNAPKYLYSYQPTYIQCTKSKCKVSVLVDEIELDYDDYGNSATICPNCGWIGTFPEYQYQKIEECI